MTLDRSYWLRSMLDIADPLLSALEKEQLVVQMPIEQKVDSNRESYSYLEAFARLINGMAPWLESHAENEAEEKLRKEYVQRVRICIDHATNPNSKDYMNFSVGDQPIVDTAFFAQAILRAPQALWYQLEPITKRNVIKALKATRSRKPHFSNWLLFSAIIETALYKMGEDDWDPMRIDYALNQFEQWYVGDGLYSDGNSFHADYYNSYVIHPMLLDISETVGPKYSSWSDKYQKFRERAVQYAVIQERMISPEGTYPPIGRSLAYRFGAFHHLANQVLRYELPSELTAGQVRAALTSVIKRTFSSDAVFNENGWLKIGFTGHQPEIGEAYVSTGSLYLSAFIFLPLGLKESDPFWQEDAKDWTSKKAWASQDFPVYQSLD
ncbi:hypothetical protein SAMN04487943_103130 [Gracilibacillus orientalis]|uniref:DUF2264 domain-containing protein n=1 Tax=Gracilibacillus orientalis TaxID=334253 RepID=A0A1I4JSZ6_9BACI|nr:DUF2264 domain-containing protein [Gracilibacillus orientalis]SFL69363.1 hypothetical protein SAMN04487943_103130 [Gracilibacillus orientalis]